VGGLVALRRIRREERGERELTGRAPGGQAAAGQAAGVVARPV
jgi:hypothetical protein